MLCRLAWTVLWSDAMLLNAIGCAPQHEDWTACDDDAYLHLELFKVMQIEFRLLHDEVELYWVMDGTFWPPDLTGIGFETWPGASIVSVRENGRGGIHRVHEYRSFVNCVDIRSPEDAVEFFRFFSRWDVWKLMPDGDSEFEVYPDPSEPIREGCGGYGSKIPPDVWKANGLAEPSAVNKGDHFEVVRFVIRENPLTERRRLYEVTERIGREGKGYQRLSEEEVTPTPALLDDAGPFAF